MKYTYTKAIGFRPLSSQQSRLSVYFHGLRQSAKDRIVDERTGYASAELDAKEVQFLRDVLAVVPLSDTWNGLALLNYPALVVFTEISKSEALNDLSIQLMTWQSGRSLDEFSV